MGLKEVEDILRDVDLNGDGLVDFEGKITFSFLLPKEKGNTGLTCVCVCCLSNISKLSQWTVLLKVKK